MPYDTSYGLSEGGGPGITHIGTQNESKIGSVGKPSLVWDVRIVTEDGRDVGKDEVGEIVVKGSGIMKEYYKNPEATSQMIRKGWLHTGISVNLMRTASYISSIEKKISLSQEVRTSILLKLKPLFKNM